MSGWDKFCLGLKDECAHAIDRDNFSVLLIDPSDHLVRCIPDALATLQQFSQGILAVAPMGQVAKGDLTHIKTEVVHDAKEH